MTAEPNPIHRQSIAVRGLVQGVGFRPFVHRLASEEQLSGFVSNDSDGVSIEVEGPAANLASFLSRLRAEAPPLARIDSVTAHDLPLRAEAGFTIIPSQTYGPVSTAIPADAATCQDCLHEILDTSDRRYRYPFTNCTNCGPRFTITRQIPYDRPQTSMAGFTMCLDCQAEYDDPANRRFHAQPNACPTCGPHLWLVDSHGNEIRENDPIALTIDLLLEGRILAIKGIGGFHLAVDAANEDAITRLRQRKHRNEKPFAVMVRGLDAARSICSLTAEDEALLETPARPIVLARQRANTPIAPTVAPGLPLLGVFLPYAPLHHLLFADPRIPALVMTSANLSEEPIAIDNDEALSRLKDIADAFLLHNREILQRCDDSVAAIVDSVPQLIRRARGYVPHSVPLPIDSPPLLAVGGHLKNVFTLARGRYAYQSQHLGDLESPSGLHFFEESLAHLKRTFDIEPTAVVHDLHPNYLSTTWAKQFAAERNLPLIAVQHHHAHIAACIAESRLTGPVIGLALDGTGYGSDGRIWGGEVLIVDLDTPDFRRFAHLSYTPMPGGDAAVREPWRMAFDHLLSAGFSIEEVQELTAATDHEARLLARMIDRELNSPLTSSLGRLFDAVASIVINRRAVDYEAQAAIELEGIAIDAPLNLDDKSYLPELLDGSPYQIGTKPLWQAIVRDLRANIAAESISARFHAAIARAFVQCAILAREATGIQQVAMSGGCLHNRRLAQLLRAGLESNGFSVHRHKHVSPGDGGLSYGQAVVASAVLRIG